MMALARLTFEFASEFQVIAAELLPPICSLLQSKAREVIKAALGFLRVVALRVPVDLVAPHLALIIEGVLVWAEDSKNKFKLKVRRLIERLCKRCGYEAVAAAWPEAHQKLLTAVRKGMARSGRQKSRDRAGEGSEGGESAASGARTARASEWGHSRIFSDEDLGGGEDGDARSRAGMSAKSKQSKSARTPASSALPCTPFAAVTLHVLAVSLWTLLCRHAYVHTYTWAAGGESGLLPVCRSRREGEREVAEPAGG